MRKATLYLGELWHAPEAPAWGARGDQALRVVARGALAVDEGGRILEVGPRAQLEARWSEAERVDFGDDLIVPGFVDAHVHFPQIDIVGAYGERLLGWLDTHTFPAEARFADPAHAASAATRFVTELLANGTTLAAVFTSSHLVSAEALFAEAERRGIRAIIGKTSMDRGAPPALLVPAADDLAANERLIGRWHGRDGRLFVALTPRFALSCSEGLLAGLGRLKGRYPDVYVQTHHAETPEEVAAVARAFPGERDYLSVYERFGLVGPKTILGHSIHVTAAEQELLVARDARIAHCPTSNLFLGSGLFPLARLAGAGIKVALGTDVGAGTSFSLVRTMDEAYKVQKLRREPVSPVLLFHLATQGGAEALGLGEITGSFAVGKEADFQVIAWRRSRLLAARWEGATPLERLGAWMALGDDRLTRAVFVRGRSVYGATGQPDARPD